MKIILIFLFQLLILSQEIFAQDLLESVEAKDHAKVAALLKSGAKVNQTSKTGQFPLWLATWNDDADMINLLIANSADVNQMLENKDSRSNCMEIACQNGLTNIVKIFVDHGARLEDKNIMGYSPLRVAARNGRIEIVKYLISKGSEIDSKANDQATPLEVAASKGHMEIVHLLVEHGAKVNHQDKDNDTPLGEAAKSGFLDVVKFLLDHGADLSLKNNDGQTAEDRANIAGQSKVQEFLKSKRS